MGTCLALFVLSWFVRTLFAPLAVAMAVVACAIPLIAVMVGNDAEEDDDRMDWDEDREEEAEQTPRPLTRR